MKSENADLCIVPFSPDYIDQVIEYEKQLRIEEPDTYFWEPDDTYRNNLITSFSDARFTNALSYLALENGKVIGRIDALIISSRADADCSTAYLDWISVLKSKRHGKIAQKMLMALQDVLKEKGIHLLIALMAGNDEAQRFYRNIENATIHDEGVWMKL
ncbi:MAG: GNAT family N-acetyltransferase [Lachnospiraceae bacterium]|nr:GNAT family N-acetyltransferase [Lachnospiraceae bacterium]